MTSPVSGGQHLAGSRSPDAPSLEGQLARCATCSGDAVFPTGLVLQELLQGFSGPKAQAAIIGRFTALPLLAPDREDHIAAAEICNACRRAGCRSERSTRFWRGCARGMTSRS